LLALNKLKTGKGSNTNFLSAIQKKKTKKLLLAYELAIQQKVKYVNDIIQELLVARKRKWEDAEAIRLEKENELLRYVKSLIENERTELLNQTDPNDDEAIETINYHIVSLSQ
jgi:STIP1 family protein 1